MVDQFHVHVHVEPCGRLAEEAVCVSCDVPFAQRSNELRFEACWVKRSQVNTYKLVLVKHVSTACSGINKGWSYRRGPEHG